MYPSYVFTTENLSKGCAERLAPDEDRADAVQLHASECCTARAQG